MLASVASTQRDLFAPLLPHDDPVAKAKDEVHDEEAPPERWSGDGDGDVSEAEELRKSLRFYRKVLFGGFSKWGRIVNLVMYVMYLLVAVLIVLQQVEPTKIRQYYIASVVFWAIWQLMAIVNGAVYGWGGRQCYAWGGLYLRILHIFLEVATIVFLSLAFSQDSETLRKLPLQDVLLIFMAVTIYVDQKVIRPLFQKLYWSYQGAVTKDEVIHGVEELPLIANISTNVLAKVALNASKAIGISDEGIQTIQELLKGQRIRQDKEKARDDWTLTIHKITKAVSFAPFSLCQSKASITSTQCRNLVTQMIIYLRVYLDTGKVAEDEASLKRTAPLSFGEAFVLMLKFSMQVPLSFVIGLIPRSIFGVVMAALVPSAVQHFTNGLMTGDMATARPAFELLMILTAIAPVINVFANLAESSFTNRMVDNCRRKMLRSMLKGGTKFDDMNRPGSLIDAFASQISQVEIYCQQFFLMIMTQVLAMVAAIWFAAGTYPFAVILFISLIPVILSVEYFQDRSTRAADKATQFDAKFTGKISSAVQCRNAIRAGDAGDWVNSDMQDVLADVKKSHFLKFFRAQLVQNFVEMSGAVYTLLILVPLGIAVLNGQIPVGDFLGINMATMFLITPITIFGQAMNNTLLFSGAIQSVNNLMGDSLDEEPPSKSSDSKIELSPLTDSLNLSGIRFRYNLKQEDVISGVDASIHKGTYNVIFGESGSGKSTILSLLMRFYEPYEGSIKWQGQSIYDTSLKSFRKQVAVMFQNTMIYQATVRDNILFGMPEEPGLVEKAANDAEIADVIERLPQGYDTEIGGDSLAGMSGGQLQRICLARALYKKPSVLLLDEATSALDAETEHSIISTLVNLRDKEGITLVAVSHRPATAVKANKIVVLKYGGTIVEEGNYDELVSREGGRFRRMVDAGDDE